MPFLSPNQQCQSTEGKNITFHGLAYPKLTWGLATMSQTTNSSWLPWGRVAMPLISPLMPVPMLIWSNLWKNRSDSQKSQRSPQQGDCLAGFLQGVKALKEVDDWLKKFQ